MRNVIMTSNGYLSDPYVLMDVKKLSGVTDKKHGVNVNVRIPYLCDSASLIQ